jgi:HNH endonuclease
MSSEQLSVIFVDPPQYAGYRIGRDGSIWTCRKRGNGGGKFYSTWRRMKPGRSKTGHMHVELFPGPRRRLVHRLVLEAFVGPCPPGMEACHDPDPNPANNRLENLRWDTHKANQQDMGKHGHSQRGEKMHLAKLTTEKALAIRAEYKPRYGEQTRLAKKYGVTQSAVWSIVNGKTWKHLPPPPSNQPATL